MSSDSSSDESSDEEPQTIQKSVVKQPVEEESDSSDSSDSEDEAAKAPKPVAVVKPTPAEDSDSDSSSDSEDEAPAKPVVPTPKAAPVADDSDSSDSSDSEDEPPAKAVAPIPQAKPGPAAADSDSDSDSSDSEEEAPAKAAAPVPKVKPTTPAAADSDSDSSDSSDDEEETKPKATKPAVVAKPAEDSDSDSSSDEEDEAPKPVTPAKTAAPPKPASAEESDSDDSSDSDDEDEKPKPVAKPVAAATENNDDDSDSSEDEEEEKKTVVAAPAVEDDDEKEIEEKAEEKKEEITKLPASVTITPLFYFDLTTKPSRKEQKGKKRKLEFASQTDQPAKKAKAETDENKITTPQKEFDPTNFKNAHLKDTTCQVFVGGIDINAFEDDVKEFFSDIETPLSVRHRWNEDRPGIAFVSFSSPQMASRAVIEKHHEYIKDRYVNCDWAEERKKSFNSGGRSNRGPKNAHLKDTTERIWVGNLHREVYDDQVIEFFKDIGNLTDVYIIGRDPDRPKIAYVSFETKELATKAVETLQGEYLMDQNVRLDWAEPRHNSGGGGRGQKRSQALSEKQEGCVTCFVGRLPDTVDDDKLADLFKDCGEISGIRYMERDGEFKGVAFVEFTETEATDKAVLLNGSDFLGRQIRVDFAGQSKKKKEW